MVRMVTEQLEVRLERYIMSTQIPESDSLCCQPGPSYHDFTVGACKSFIFRSGIDVSRSQNKFVWFSRDSEAVTRSFSEGQSTIRFLCSYES